MKPILDVCCGSKMFYFDKNNPNVVFMDCRELEDTLCDGRKLEIKPDIIGDFRNIPFPDNTFHLVVFDPPHLIKVAVVQRNRILALEIVVLENIRQC